MPRFILRAVAGKVRAAGADGALRAFRPCALAEFLTVALQAQIGADTRIKPLRNFSRDRLLCFAVCHSVAFAFETALDSHEDMRAVRGNGSYGRDASKEQYSICTGISDIRKFLEQFAYLHDRSDKGRAEVARKLITRAAISLSRIALSSGTIPPGRKARPRFAGDAASRSSRSTPISRVNDCQPFAHVVSLAGYPQCHHTKKRYGSV